VLALLRKPVIDCARLPREAMFVALPHKVDTILPREAERTLPRANLACVEPNRSRSLSHGKGISVFCALSVETVLCLRNSVTRLPRFDAGHEHGKQTNEFAAHEQLRAAAARNQYPALEELVSVGIRSKNISNSKVKLRLTQDKSFQI
jgi:hypothetical protein